MAEGTCVICGLPTQNQPSAYRNSGRPSGYCSDECRAEQKHRYYLANKERWAERHRQNPTRTSPELGGFVDLKCPICGASFRRRENAKRKETCGKRACLIAHHTRRESERRAALRGFKDCLHCGETFHPLKPWGVYCSKECGSAAHALVRKLSKRGGEHRPLALPFNRRELAERDGWVCGICCEPIPREARHPNPLALSVDHVVPLARGGTNELDNLQAAHLRCNLSKRADGVSLTAG